MIFRKNKVCKSVFILQKNSISVKEYIFCALFAKIEGMKQKIKTAIQFSKNILTTGAIFETSKKVETEVCKFLPQGNKKVIVEYGTGHGNITKQILDRISDDSILYTFEVNEEFCRYVENEIKDNRLVVINDGAENMAKHITESIDSVIATIPFSFFSKEKSDIILNKTYELLNVNCFYSQALYTKHNYKKFLEVYDNCDFVKLGGFPREYVYHCQKL